MMLYDVYKPSVNPTAPNLPLISQTVPLDMVLFIQASFLFYIFLMTFKLILLIFLPKQGFLPICSFVDISKPETYILCPLWVFWKTIIHGEAWLWEM